MLLINARGSSPRCRQLFRFLFDFAIGQSPIVVLSLLILDGVLVTLRVSRGYRRWDKWLEILIEYFRVHAAVQLSRLILLWVLRNLAGLH
jgi:hypothetical protein